MVNPYRSPVGSMPQEGQYVPAFRPGARATLVARGLLLRRIVIEAPVEITLEFNGRSLYDKVIVNGQVAARKTSWWRITPRLEFSLPMDQQLLRGRVDVRVWPWLAIRGFRVTIADHTVYAEGSLRPT